MFPAVHHFPAENPVIPANVPVPRTRLGLRLLALLLLVAVISPVQGEEKPSPSYSNPVLIRVEGSIDDWLESYLLRKIDQAVGLKCDLLILEIDSPGGGLAETLNLCDHLTSLQNVHTVAYVPREALSGAAILSLACDEIVIGKFARIGDCGPIYLAEDFMFRHAPEKIKSDLVQRVRVLSEKKGHPPALAEAMVDMQTPVLRVREKATGSTKLVTAREVDALGDGWEKLETLPESGGGRFLTLAGERAIATGLAAALAESRDAVLQRFGTEKSLRVLQPTVIDRTLYLLNHWLVTGVLLVVGLSALGYELSAPGMGIGGLVAALCFALFFWSRFLGGTSGWLEVVLFLAGVGFLAVEIFVLPGFGVAGVMGILLIVGALVLASLDFTLPQNNAELWKGANSVFTVLGALGCGGLVIGISLQYVESIPILKRLMLQPPGNRENALDDAAGTSSKEPPTSSPVHVGAWGESSTMLRPGGKARFGDEVVDVVAEGSFIDAGRPLRIIAMQGLRIVVEEVTSDRQV